MMLLTLYLFKNLLVCCPLTGENLVIELVNLKYLSTNHGAAMQDLKITEILLAYKWVAKICLR